MTTTENRALLQGRPSTFQPKFSPVKRPEPDAIRTVGFGKTPDLEKIKASTNSGLGAMQNFADQLRDSVCCPMWNMPIMEYTRLTMLGPQTDDSIRKNFGSEVDIFCAGRDVTGIDCVTSTVCNGQLQTNMIALGVGVHIEPEPFRFTVDGNAWTHPTGTVAQPPSPDVFTANDVNNGALGPAFVPGLIPPTPAAQTLMMAQLEWGWWAQYAAWHMVRAYNLRWRIGQHCNIMDDLLRNTAFTPGEGAGGGDSDVDVIDFVRRVNDRYDSLGSAMNFLKVNRIRIGSVLAGAANVGIFRPSRDHERVPVGTGATPLGSALAGNSEYRKLCLPYVIKAGVGIGLVMEEVDSCQADIMRAYLSITQGFGGGIVPPVITDAAHILAGSGATGSPPVAFERTLDGFNVPQQMDSQRVIFKGGELKITLAVKGFEVGDDWYCMLQNNPTLRDLIMSECGVGWAKTSG